MTAEQLETLRHTWKQHLEAWKQSGQSQVAYCREHGLKPHQLTYWKGRFAQSQSSTKLIPLRLPALPAEPSITVAVTLPDGVRLEVPAKQATELLPKLLPALRAAP